MRGIAVVALGVLGGCSQVFGLEQPTRAPQDAPLVGEDATLDDAAPDAPVVVPDAGTPRSLGEMIDDLGLQSSLLVALDAGDLASYSGGASQIWQNTAPGATVSFFRGPENNNDGEDPTFVGTPGARTQNEFFTFDGDDFFVESVGGWGDDAFLGSGAKLTILAVSWLPINQTFWLFSNCRCDQALDLRGVVYYRQTGSATMALYQEILNNANTAPSTATFGLNAWHVSAVAVDANGGTSDIRHMVDTQIDELTNETVPYADVMADRQATIGASPTGTSAAPAGTRIAMFAVWNRALSAAELSSLYAAIKAERFTSLP